MSSHKRIYTEVARCVPLIINHGPYPHSRQFQRSQSIYTNFKSNRAHICWAKWRKSEASKWLGLGKVRVVHGTLSIYHSLQCSSLSKIPCWLLFKKTESEYLRQWLCFSPFLKDFVPTLRPAWELCKMPEWPVCCFPVLQTNTPIY